MQNAKKIWPAIAIGLILIATIFELHLQGRLWRCACSRFFVTTDAWGSDTSQLFLDPYSFTHVIHGLAFAGLLALLVARMPVVWRFVMVIALESAWEVIENTNTIIERYRQATASLGYQGDTVVNSLGDIFCCGVGFILARKLGWLRSILLFLTIEIFLLILFRDSLLLEIIMLVHPIQAIKSWQLAR